MTQPLTLHDLIRMTGNGDQSAHKDLYLKMRQPVMKHVLSKYGDKLAEEDAEEIMHITFIKVTQYASRYNGAYEDASARNWIYKIARSEALKMIKAQEKVWNMLDDPRKFDSNSDNDRAFLERSLQLSDKHWEGEFSVEERVSRTTILEKILASIQRLSTAERNMLALRYEHEYTLEQIGHQIGRTKPRVKQIIDGLVDRIRKSAGVDPDKD